MHASQDAWHWCVYDPRAHCSGCCRTSKNDGMECLLPRLLTQHWGLRCRTQARTSQLQWRRAMQPSRRPCPKMLQPCSNGRVCTGSPSDTQHHLRECIAVARTTGQGPTRCLSDHRIELFEPKPCLSTSNPNISRLCTTHVVSDACFYSFYYSLNSHPAGLLLQTLFWQHLAHPSRL